MIFTMWRSPQAKYHSADTYIGNLALADLAFVVILPLWAAYMALRFHWPFGLALCKLSSYLVLFNMFTSAFCLGSLSFEHYLAIMRSLLRSRPMHPCTALADPKGSKADRGQLHVGLIPTPTLIPVMLCYPYDVLAT
ncbi:hypothetical protein KIL84_011592 [Mauremys mutica]|uniref:G-protein coupled receptors family 1 profile domain-containing protein n=1 Tax=Mauremys mutica TaxID=74926 RepID=A0A9D3XF37_9SAUR|nr:hypothetical protein KIL84_011592 [Mauremys mutica]